MIFWCNAQFAGTLTQLIALFVSNIFIRGKGLYAVKMKRAAGVKSAYSLPFGKQKDQKLVEEEAVPLKIPKELSKHGWSGYPSSRLCSRLTAHCQHFLNFFALAMRLA